MPSTLSILSTLSTLTAPTMSSDSHDRWRAFWNERYAEPEPAYGTEPNVFFAEQIAGVTPGRILLPAEGQGRNALHAASLCWEVVACDYSEAGRRGALKAADEAGLSIDYEVVDLADPEHLRRLCAKGPFDTLGVFYMHLPPAHQGTVLDALCSALAPGGTLLLELFSPEQLHYASGGPRNAEMLCDPDWLRQRLTPHFTSLEVGQHLIELHEGPYHRGAASVVRATGVR